jgi:hypothetical protein
VPWLGSATRGISPIFQHSDAFRELFINLAERDLMFMIIPEIILRRTESFQSIRTISPTSVFYGFSRPASGIACGKSRVRSPFDAGDFGLLDE